MMPDPMPCILPTSPSIDVLLMGLLVRRGDVDSPPAAVASADDVVGSVDTRPVARRMLEPGPPRAQGGRILRSCPLALAPAPPWALHVLRCLNYSYEYVSQL